MVHLTNVLFDLACETSFNITQVLIKVYLTTGLDNNSNFLVCETSFDLTQVLITICLTTVLLHIAFYTLCPLKLALILLKS